MTEQRATHEWTETTWKKALYAIFDRCTEDPSFRHSCVNDPRSVFRQVAGVELPPDVHVTFDASQDAASIPEFKDVFVTHQPVVIQVPATRTVHTMTSR